MIFEPKYHSFSEGIASENVVGKEDHASTLLVYNATVVF